MTTCAAIRFFCKQSSSRIGKHKLGILKLKERLNLNTFEKWDLLSKKQVEEHIGSSIFQKYTLYDIKCFGYPEGKENFRKKDISKTPGHWGNQKNIINFLHSLKEQTNLNTPEDWNKISRNHIQAYGGGTLLNRYSLYELKCMVCPEGKSIFKSPRKPPGYWDNPDNIQIFLTKLKTELNLKTPEDWKKVSQKQIQLLGGTKLLSKYTLYEILCMGCIEVKSIFDKREDYKSRGYWEKEENIQNFLDKLKTELNLKTPEDWNSITTKNIKDLGGFELLKQYSIYGIKCMGCIEGTSLYEKRKKYKKKGYWDKDENIQNFLNELKDKLNLNTTQDWQRLSKTQIQSHGGWGFLSKVSEQNLAKIQSQFPQTKIKHIRSSQRWLFLQIQKLFPNEEIIEDYYHSEISRETGFPVQFDIFLVERNIAIEYHGIQHYEDTPHGFAPLEMYQNRDKEKERISLKHGIHLVVIPYWWDNKIDSLQNTINSKIAP